MRGVGWHICRPLSNRRRDFEIISYGRAARRRRKRVIYVRAAGTDFLTIRILDLSLRRRLRVFFLPPRPVYFIDLAPPRRRFMPTFLPVPALCPGAGLYQHARLRRAAAQNNIIYNNIHNTVVVNNTTNTGR